MSSLDHVTEAQYKQLAIAPKVSGIISLFASIVLIRDVLSSKKKRSNTYSRIMLGMTIIDILVSIAFILSTWAIPIDGVDTDIQAPYRSGNTSTCIIQGILVQLAIASNIYNLCLAIYFFLSVRTRCLEEEMKKYEKMMHLAALTFGFGTAIAGIPLKLYNSAGPWCWISSLPHSCGLTKKSDPSTCIRGKYAYAYRYAFFYFPLWIIILAITVIMTTMACHVRKVEKQTVRYSFSVETRNSLTSKVARQAFFYVIALYLTWGPGSVGRLLETFNVQTSFLGLLLATFLAPLQGFFNCLIYFMPKNNGIFCKSCTFGKLMSTFSTHECDSDIDLMDPALMLRKQKEENNSQNDDDSDEQMHTALLDKSERQVQTVNA